MNLLQKIGLGLFIIAFGVFIASLGLSTYQLDEATLKSSINDDYQYSIVEKYLEDMRGKTYPHNVAFISAFNSTMKKAQQGVKEDVENNLGLTTSDGEYWNKILQDWKIKDARYAVTRASTTGFLMNNSRSIFFLSFILGIIGALMHILPMYRHLPGIKNNHIYQSSLHSKGWLGIIAGGYLIGFYILLYFFPEYIANWVILVEPVKQTISGWFGSSNVSASRWFLYGFLYTIAVTVMGIRMIMKYRHNNYQMIRTASVIFFQIAFAFMIPEIMESLNQPAGDLKNIWPLDYDFFFDWNLTSLVNGGGLGIFMLVWGIFLIIVGVPLFTFLFGKRWYCSWVCGCGGLAETLGDPFRQLSDKRLKAWRLERWIIHSVMVFAVVMTGAVLYHYFTGNAKVLSMDAYKVRETYGFMISSIFAGVIGTGFYPLMGNRAWCRFGCPLAGYFGLIQRWRSRFRITTNGGQCISCGNCSTYCEMGIDVRAYAQKGQDIVRSSCVGCGVCAAVCPRGVLRLENGSNDIENRTKELRALHIDPNGITLLN